jgi:hypothetical protein
MSRARSKTVTQPPREADTSTLFLRIVRATLLLLIVVVGCYVAYGFGRLWADWREMRQPVEASAVTAVDPNMLSPSMPLEGPWSFAQLDWDIRSRIVTSSDVSTRFDKPISIEAGLNHEQLPDVSQELIELAGRLGAKTFERDGNQIYRLDRPNLKAQLLVHIVGGQSKVVSLAAALPQNNKRWQLFELTPRRATGLSADSLPQLLPLPPGARRDGGRFADDGRALLELVSLDSNANELLLTWKASGWDVRPNEAVGSHEFSYLCARGDEVIYVWSADPPNALKNLMLVRTPTGPDTDATDAP